MNEERRLAGVGAVRADAGATRRARQGFEVATEVVEVDVEQVVEVVGVECGREVSGRGRIEMSRLRRAAPVRRAAVREAGGGAPGSGRRLVSGRAVIAFPRVCIVLVIVLVIMSPGLGGATSGYALSTVLILADETSSD